MFVFCHNFHSWGVKSVGDGKEYSQPPLILRVWRTIPLQFPFSFLIFFFLLVHLCGSEESLRIKETSSDGVDLDVRGNVIIVSCLCPAQF